VVTNGTIAGLRLGEGVAVDVCGSEPGEVLTDTGCIRASGVIVERGATQLNDIAGVGGLERPRQRDWCTATPSTPGRRGLRVIGS
jgi:hypothetical protein